MQQILVPNFKHMKKLIILSIISIWIMNLNAQDVKKGFKYLNRGDLEKAEEEFMGMYRINKYNAAASYGLALTYSTDSYKNKDYFAAYDYAKQSEVNYDKLRANEIDDLKNYISKEKVESKADEIDDKLFAYVEASNDYTLLKRYLDKCKDSKHYRKALNLRYEFEYKQAKEMNTEEAFDNFIKNNPYSDKIKEAKKLREKAAYNEAVTANTEEAFTQFLEKYPNSEFVDNAIKKRVEAAYNEAKQKNTVEAYSAFMDKYPKAPQNQEIKKELNKAAFERMKNNNTYDAYNEYLATAPAGALYVQAFNMKANFMSNEYLLQSGFDQDKMEWIRVFDDDGRNDRAMALEISANQIIYTAGYSKQKDDWFCDGWLGAFNKKGNLVWDYKLITETDDRIYDIAPAIFNSLYAAGRKSAQFRADEEFAWIAKFDTNGNLLWEKTMKGTNTVAIESTPKGDAVATGYTDMKDGNRDLWVVKVSKSGNIEWRKTFPSYGEPVDIKVHKNGSINVVAQFRTLMLSSSGSKIADIKYNDPNKAYAAALSASGDLFVAGRYYNFKDEPPTKSDFWVLKISKGKSKSWSKTFYNSSYHDIATSISSDQNGNIMLAGTTAQLNDHFKNDLWLLKLNSSGNKISNYSFGSNENEKQPSVIFTKEGNPILFFSQDYKSDNVMIMMK